MEKKNVIFVWTKDPFNVREAERNPDSMFWSKFRFWGIGDVIYGILCVNYICKKLNCNFYIDFSKHPVSKFLAENNHPFTDIVNNTKNINLSWFVEDEIKKNKSNVILIFSIGCDTIKNKESFLKSCNSNKIIDYLNKILIPNKNMLNHIDILKKKYNIGDNYNIFHFRLGDDEMMNNKIKYESLFKDLIKFYNKHRMNDEIVLSDTIKFKKVLRDKCNSNIINFDNIGHFGVHDNLDNIQNSLTEFFLCLNANHIKTFSFHRHSSGFVRLPSLLKNIKLESYFKSEIEKKL